MIIPPYLTQNSCIGVLSTAKSISKERAEPTLEMLRQAGFQLKIGKTIDSSFHQFAGTDEERLQDFQTMLDDPEIDAILCARGGYGTVRILDAIDFKKFKKNPKWICGFSDITYLHNHIHSTAQIATLHSLMCSTHDMSILPDLPMQSLIQALKGERNYYEFPTSQYNRGEEMKGVIIGGNLSILYALNGSKSMPETKGKILFIEDLTEYRYHIDRMMYNLKRSGTLDDLKGLLVGSFTDIVDNDIPFGYEVEKIILNAVKDKDYPVIFNFPAGHQGDNRAIKMGMECQINKNKEKDSLIFTQ